jgi:hypothetical protein
MSRILPLLAAASFLIAAAPAGALTLLPPAGQYLGQVRENQSTTIFSLDLSDLNHAKVRNFEIFGTRYFSAAPWHYGSNTYGYFNVRLHNHQNMHIWGTWKSQYGHMLGGYAYDYHEHRITRHYDAAADGF